MSKNIRKIGICGSHGTGKTTLAKRLSEETGLPLIIEQARIVAEQLNINIRDLEPKSREGFLFQYGCLNYQIKEEQARWLGFVSDRTTIDNAAYWTKLYAGLWPARYSLRYYEVAFNNVKNYDLIIYVPIEFELVDDGVRHIGLDMQKEIDIYIRAYLSLNARNYITVSGTTEERLERVLKELRQN